MPREPIQEPDEPRVPLGNRAGLLSLANVLLWLVSHAWRREFLSLAELAICMAGRKWGAQYEFFAHRRIGIEAGLNPAILDAVALGQRPADMVGDETIVYDFVTDLLSTGQVSDGQ